MMNKSLIKENFFSNSSPPCQKILGRILQKQPKKVYNKESPFYQQIYYKLQVLDEENKLQRIFIYPNLVKEEIFSQLITQIQINKWIHFFCQKLGKRWILHHWKELNH